MIHSTDKRLAHKGNYPITHRCGHVEYYDCRISGAIGPDIDRAEQFADEVEELENKKCPMCKGLDKAIQRTSHLPDFNLGSERQRAWATKLRYQMLEQWRKDRLELEIVKLPIEQRDVVYARLFLEQLDAGWWCTQAGMRRWQVFLYQMVPAAMGPEYDWPSRQRAEHEAIFRQQVLDATNYEDGVDGRDITEKVRM